MVDVHPSLRIYHPGHEARLWDVARVELHTSLVGDVTKLPRPPTTICVEVAREWERTAMGRSVGMATRSVAGKMCSRNTTAWRLGICNDTNDVAHIVSTTCYGIADLRWRQVWWDNFEPMCEDVSSIRWSNYSYGPLDTKCAPVALRLTVRALSAGGEEALVPARSRFFVSSRYYFGRPFPGGAWDGLGNIHVRNACRARWRGQLAQDALVLGMHFCKQDGFYIDIGSNDGEELSNTAVLDWYGWSGVCVDPFPRNMKKRTCKMEEVVLYRSTEDVEFLADGAYGRIIGFSSYPRSGTDNQTARGRAGSDNLHVATVRTERLDSLILRVSAPQQIDYLSLDVEGMELEVLEGFPFDTHFVRVLTVEHNQNEPKRLRVRKFLQARGYTFVGQLRWDDVFTFKLGA